MKNLPTFKYPFGGSVKEYLKEINQDSIELFSYGSLLNKTSAERTLPSEVFKTLRPVIAYGLQRVFNRDVDISNHPRYSKPSSPFERGMLNVWRTKEDDMLNGVLLTVPYENITSLCDREFGYDLIPIKVTTWNHAYKNNHQKMEVKTAFTFLAPEDSKHVSHDILPIKEYYDIVKIGAEEIGGNFLEMWHSTTYLADKITLTKDWENQEKN